MKVNRVTSHETKLVRFLAHIRRIISRPSRSYGLRDDGGQTDTSIKNGLLGQRNE